MPGWLFYLLFLIYPSVSAKIFAAFQCEQLDDGTQWLRADLSVRCYTTTHHLMCYYAAAMVVIYPIGTPLLYYWLLLLLSNAMSTDQEMFVDFRT